MSSHSSRPLLKAACDRLTPDVVLVTAEGEIDLSTDRLLATVLDDAVARRAHAVVVDLARVTFCGSAGLSVLIEANARCVENGQVLALVPSSMVRRALAVTGLSQIFTAGATRDEVVATLGVG